MKTGTVNGFEFKNCAYVVVASSLVIIVVLLIKIKTKGEDTSKEGEKPAVSNNSETTRKVYNNSVIHRHNHYYGKKEPTRSVIKTAEPDADTIDNFVKEEPIVWGAMVMASGLTVYYLIMTFSNYFKI